MGFSGLENPYHGTQLSFLLSFCLFLVFLEVGAIQPNHGACTCEARPQGAAVSASGALRMS